MKKRKLRDELMGALARIEEYEDAWSRIWVAVGTEPGDYEAPQWARSSGTPTAEITTVVARRMHSLRSARSAARLWKRAAKCYRIERDLASKERSEAWAELLAPHTWSEADRLRAERDAARAELASMRKDRDAVNEDCATLKAERDAAVKICTAERDDAIRAADSRHAKLVEVADKLREVRAERDRMRPVVEAAVQAYDAAQASSGTVLQEVARIGTLQKLDLAVEAYRAGGDDSGDVVQVTIDDKGIIRALDGDYVGVFEKPAPDIPDIQRTYRAPDNDTAERIADDVTSTEPPAIPAWVVRRRIEALVDDGIRGSMLRIAIACDIHEASGHVVDDIAEAIERLKRDRSLLAATTGEARKLEADAFAYRKHFRAVASAIGAHITEDEWEEMTPATAGRVAEEVDAAQPEPAEPTPAAPVHVLLEQLGEAVARADMWESAAGEWRNTVERVTRERDEARDHAEACVDEALEAAAERAVKWWNGTNSSTASLRRAVMGDEE
jgi:hypothetical protein